MFFYYFVINIQSASNLADWGIVGYGIICIICASAWPFLFCYFATIATERIIAVGQTTFNLNWYDYPPELQKFIVLIVARSQKPAYFTGLGIVHCSLETLGKVSNIEPLSEKDKDSPNISTFFRFSTHRAPITSFSDEFLIIDLTKDIDSS